MNELELSRRACATDAAMMALGNETIPLDGGVCVRNREAPLVRDANHIAHARCESPEAVERLLRQMDREMDGAPHRGFRLDPWAPQFLEARLALEHYQRNEGLLMVLEGELLADARDAAIREATSDDDWAAIAALDVLHWAEEAEQTPRGLPPALGAEYGRVKRGRCPEFRYWLAEVDGAPRAYFSSWAGVDGVGIIEDLFTHPGYRRMGLATALIVRAVADARERGAGPVVIPADPADWPKRLYAAMGFTPLVLLRSYWKNVDAPA